MSESPDSLAGVMALLRELKETTDEMRTTQLRQGQELFALGDKLDETLAAARDAKRLSGQTYRHLVPRPGSDEPEPED